MRYFSRGMFGLLEALQILKEVDWNDPWIFGCFKRLADMICKSVLKP